MFCSCLRSVEVVNCCSDHKKFQKPICTFDENQKSNAKLHKIHKPKWIKWKNQSFLKQKPENQSKLSQNCKTKNPNALLLIEEWYIPLASFCPWQHDTTLLNTAVKVTTWSFGENNSQMDLHSIVSPRVYFGMLCSILNFHWKYFNFFTSFFF